MTERRLVVKSTREERKPVKTPLENMNSFLYKLWSLVNDETIPTIHWSHDGDKVVIENPSKFTAKVLGCSDKQLFKTKNISSFIRQLNLYGFRRVKENCGKIPLIYSHEAFRQGRPDLLVKVRRKKPVPMNKLVSPTLLIPSPKLPKPIMQQNQMQTRPTPYPSLPRTQPYPPYFNNPPVVGRKNVPMPFVTPFAVNHGPTFINLGPHSTIFSKPRVQAAGRISKVEEDSTSTEKPESKELYDLKNANETPYYPWQNTAYYTTKLQDQKTPTPSYNNSMACQAFMQIHGNYQKYPPPFFNGNMFPPPGYRNYGDPTTESMQAYQNLRSHAFSGNPYLPFTSFHAPQFLKPAGLASSPPTEHSPNLDKVKTEETTTTTYPETTTTKLTSLESFSIFSSHVPKTEVNEKIISGLTADEEKEWNFDEKE